MSIFDSIMTGAKSLIDLGTTYLGFEAKKAQGEAQVEQARAEAAQAEAEALAEALRGENNAFQRQISATNGAVLNGSLAQPQSSGDGPPIIINQAPAQQAQGGFLQSIGGQILVGVAVAVAVAAFTGAK